METSILVAQIYGVVASAVGLGLILNGKYYQKAFDKMLKNPAFIYYGGLMALVVGFLIVNAHNVWVKDWTVIVTIIGWGALLKGIWLIIAPESLINLSRSMLKNTNVLGWCVLIIGLVFAYFGFVA
jgi:hypothetical protein